MGTMNFDKIVVVDIESTCWETKEEQGNQPMEIIEIGACVLDVKMLKYLERQATSFDQSSLR